METTRRYPRTTVEAFGGPNYACAIERPDRMNASMRRAVVVAVVLLAFMLIAAAASGRG